MILSPDDFESLEETLSILAVPQALREIREGDADVDHGRYIDADALRDGYPHR